MAERTVALAVPFLCENFGSGSPVRRRRIISRVPVPIRSMYVSRYSGLGEYGLISR